MKIMLYTTKLKYKNQSPLLIKLVIKNKS
jgi:hypothetical protein